MTGTSKVFLNIPEMAHASLFPTNMQTFNPLWLFYFVFPLSSVSAQGYFLIWILLPSVLYNYFFFSCENIVSPSLTSISSCNSCWYYNTIVSLYIILQVSHCLAGTNTFLKTLFSNGVCFFSIFVIDII